MATTRKAPPPKQLSTRQRRFEAGIENSQNAIKLLKADHREVEGLFKAFKKSDSPDEQATLAQHICAALTVHMQIEEEVFYPAFIAASGDQPVHDEAVVEHDGAKKLIAEIERAAPGDPLFHAKVSVLSEMIKHHVREEEGFNGMFTKARIVKLDLLALGVLLEARKRELESGQSAATAAAPRGARARGFMGAAARARAKEPRPRARKAPVA